MSVLDFVGGDGVNSANGVMLWAAATVFDEIANSYDKLFTHTAIGWAQRIQVRARLLAAFPPGSRILELNCGTGEDARFLAKRGRSVVACDASTEMLRVARNHWEGRNAGKVRYVHMANEELGSWASREAFHGAFSNFSGLNCLADLQPVARNLAKLVIPGGTVLLCLWSRVCVAEILWYLVHGQPQKATRRFSGKATARLGKKTIAVFYPTAREVRRCFSPWFRLRSQRAIGLFVPPSYVEPAMRSHPKLLERMEWLDRLCAGWPIFRSAGDHMLLEFTRCHP